MGFFGKRVEDHQSSKDRRMFPNLINSNFALVIGMFGTKLFKGTKEALFVALEPDNAMKNSE